MSSPPDDAAGDASRRPNLTKLILAVSGGDSPLLRACLHSDWYRARNPDVVTAGVDPLAHWVSQGAVEGREPCADLLGLLDGLMGERMGLPAAAPDTTAHSPAPPEPIRIICATRKSREEFMTRAALGRSLALHLPPAVELRLFPGGNPGLPYAYNVAIDESRTRPAILLFIHDDLHLCDFFWADRLREGLRAFDVIGLAGNRRRVPRQPGWGFIDEKMSGELRENMSGTVAHGLGYPSDSIDVFGPAPQSVKLLDGLLLAARSEVLHARSVRFDERFDFDFYDLDFCRSAERAGLSMGTWPISVVHESHGGYVSDGWRRNYDRYLEKWSD